jgi:hypothetical protein
MCIVKKAPWSEVYRQHLLVGQPDPAGEISSFSQIQVLVIFYFFFQLCTQNKTKNTWDYTEVCKQVGNY